MIEKFRFTNLRNAEYSQYMNSASKIFAQHSFVVEIFGSLLDMFNAKLKTAEAALLAERKSLKVQQKNEADSYRDCLHSKLFDYMKSVLHDVRDWRYANAVEIMNVIKRAGNPRSLPENAESAMLAALCADLEPLREKLEYINAHTFVDELRAANQRFIAIEEEYRQMLAGQELDAQHMSMSALRRQITPLYRAIVNAINGYAGVPDKKEQCTALTAEMNVLVARYEALLNTRTDKDADNTTPGPVPNPPPRG
ncbi:MAG: DUF6261 family protein [Bacteroidales bacterium]|jgi:hypothetical protein|nr:DUF6261 family protein [Bacteroidales bacterium]